MRTILLMTAAILLASCASTDPQAGRIQAVDDFVEVGELEPVKEIRYRRDLRHEYLNDEYAFVKTRKQDYLVKFARRCAELRDNTRVTPDVRREANVVRARFDTIRGCRIEHIYPVNKGQVEELRSLDETPDSRY